MWPGPLVLDDPAVLIVASDPHYDEDQATSAYRPLRVLGGAWAAMGADGGLLLGDLTSRTLGVPAPSGGTCSASTVFSSTCPLPSGAAATWWNADTSSIADRLWAIPGNHDGNPPLPNAGPPWNTLDGWWLATIRPLDKAGVVGGTWDAYEVQLQVGAGTWSLLMLGDRNNEQDREIGGRCADALNRPGRCSTRAMSAGALDLAQLQWLEDRIAAARRDGRFVAIGSHQPPANSTVGSWEGEATREVCPGVVMHGGAGHPRDALQVPDRTDLDQPAPWDPAGRTPLQVAEAWAGALVLWQPDSAPRPTWAAELLAKYPGTVRLWLAGHNHIPTPDASIDGHGTRALVAGTPVLAFGPLTRARCSTPGACRSTAARLELRGDGTWTVERWALDPLWTPGTCTTAASLPADGVPGAWAGVPVEGP